MFDTDVFICSRVNVSDVALLVLPSCLIPVEIESLVANTLHPPDIRTLFSSLTWWYWTPHCIDFRPKVYNSLLYQLLIVSIVVTGIDRIGIDDNRTSSSSLTFVSAIRLKYSVSFCCYCCSSRITIVYVVISLCSCHACSDLFPITYFSKSSLFRLVNAGLLWTLWSWHPMLC